jgi:hypothetical protein
MSAVTANRGAWTDRLTSAEKGTGWNKSSAVLLAPRFEKATVTTARFWLHFENGRARVRVKFHGCACRWSRYRNRHAYGTYGDRVRAMAMSLRGNDALLCEVASSHHRVRNPIELKPQFGFRPIGFASLREYGTSAGTKVFHGFSPFSGLESPSGWFGSD